MASKSAMFEIVEWRTWISQSHAPFKVEHRPSHTRVSPKNHSRIYNIICFFRISYFHNSLLVTSITARPAFRFLVSYLCSSTTDPYLHRCFPPYFIPSISVSLFALLGGPDNVIRNDHLEDTGNERYTPSSSNVLK